MCKACQVFTKKGSGFSVGKLRFNLPSVHPEFIFVKKLTFQEDASKRHEVILKEIKVKT